MAVNSSILFTIGTAKGVGGFTELRSAIDLIGQMWGKIQETTKELDRFSQMWQRTNKSAVMAADSAAAGIIDTAEVLRGYQKLTAAGVKMTDEQFKTLTVRAADLAQTTGKDATEAFQRLTNSIAKGSTRALKEYGINVKEGGELTEMQAEAVNGLTEGYENLTIKAETLSERMYALDNNLGTMKGLLWDLAGGATGFEESLDSLNGALGEFNTILAESPNAAEKYILSLKGVKAALAEMQLEWLRTASTVMIAAAPPLLQSGLEKARDWMLGKVESGVSSLLQADLEGLYEETKPASKPGDFAWQGPEQAPTKERRKRGGAGGKKKKPEFDMDFTADQTEQSYQESITDAMGPSTFSVRDLTNEELAERIELETSLSDVWDRQEEQLKADKEAREELAEMRREEEEEKQAAREKEKEQAAEIREAWLRTYEDVSAGAQKQNKWVGALSKGISASFKAVEADEKNAGAAIVGVLGEVGSAISDEAGWQVLMETAKAIAAAASQNYAAAAAHGAAAIAFGVAAAAAGGGKGGSVPKESTAAKYSERFAGSDINAGGAGGGDSGGGVTISIQMKEGAGGFFDAIVEQNDEASIDGRRSFTSN